MVKIVKSESVSGKLGNVMPLVQNLLDYLLSIGDGSSGVTLHIHQESPKLLSRHVGGAVGVLLKVILNVGRRTGLYDFELPNEAHTQSVVTHLQRELRE